VNLVIVDFKKVNWNTICKLNVLTTRYRSRTSEAASTTSALDVVPKEVVHPGLLGGWWLSKTPSPRRTRMKLHGNARTCPQFEVVALSSCC
jgi:hypothetical protein